MKEKSQMTDQFGNLAGKFWYSKKMRKWMDKQGMNRLFCMIEGDIKEYTELAEFETLIDEPGYMPIYDDSEFLGEGFYYKSMIA